ncbi:S-layer homology domain-containing protein [Domibacillus enclensis]|uniref:S-layer homology domain-containing protein n=2 Tax=Domibacillus enclensis TaxID=1017273 RepID=A0A1N6Y1B3_9BACI|nr:S-layer homology domain-containing protein [Domibacillus enclensis]SIR08291.1 S-layer homology domain-containing protein [Domibacillus enclensis]
MKRLFKSVLALIMLLSLVPSASAATFKDAGTFSKEIDYLTDAGIIMGFPDGTFRPDLPIKRVDAVRMIMRELQEPLGDAPNPNFKDMSVGSKGYDEVAKAVELGIISGKPGNVFDPNGNLTRAEMATVLVRTYHLTGIYPKGFTDVSLNYWGSPYISALAANNITIGYKDGTFKPTLTISRAHFAAFMTRIIEPSFQPSNPEVADTYLEALFDMDIIDYKMHPTEPIIFVLDGATNDVSAINYETFDVVSSDELALPAERMAYANGKIYVTQHKKPHSPYWWDEDQEGAFTVVNASTLKIEKTIQIALDPYDIEADDKGVVYISSGSGQHTRVESYNSSTGAVLSSQRINDQNLIELNEAQTKLYSITTLVSPRDLSVYSITDGVLGPEKDSPYHGEYDLGKDLTLSPDGKYIFNSTGRFFRSAASVTSDMTYVGKLDRAYSSIAFDVNYGELYTANSQKFIQAYDYQTMEASGQFTTYGNVKKMFYDPNSNTLLAFTAVQLGKSTVPFTGLEVIYFDTEE